jgi:xylulokinase
MEEYLIAHDLGTSGDKATLFTTEGKMVRSAVVPYGVHYFGDHCAEQDPDDWWAAVCRATRQVLEGVAPGSVLGLSFSAQMQGCLLVDKSGKPLRPAIIWADQRSGKEAELLRKEIGADQVYRITGHRISANYTLEKLMWLRTHEPDVFRKASRTFHAKDYILYKLTGQFVTDYSDASGTNAFDLDHLQWSEEILSAAGIKKEIFPELHASTDVIGFVSREAAEATGLREGTPVVCGGGDGPCAAVGAGCIHDDELFSSFGTSSWIGGTCRKKFLDEEKILFCFAHVIPGRYMSCGTMQAAGSSYAYIRKLICPEKSYEETNEMIAGSPAGAGGLLFLPYLMGERSPRWDEQASGVFMGMRMHHGPADYLRAVIEGVAMNLELILAAYRKYWKVDYMILTGGGAKGDIICQILADVLRCSLHTPDHVEEATSIAAAVIAGVGTGIYENFEEITRFLKITKTYRPDPGTEPVYSRLRKLFDDSYQALKPVFAEF